MEVQSGQIKALVGLTKKDSTNYQSCENFSVWQSTGLMHPISLLVALETGKVKLSDKVDTGNGIYQIHGRELKDHNWHRGGYGELTVQEGLATSSNIAIYKTMEKAFANNPQSYFDLLANMSYGKPDSITGIANLKPAHFVTPKDNNWAKSDFAWSSIGYNQQISPIQILTFYNAIANNGKMIQPQGTSSLSTNEDSTKDMYAVEFCGYFPTDNPKYSIIVSINKAGLPASGELMAGDVFKKIVGLLFPY